MRHVVCGIYLTAVPAYILPKKTCRNADRQDLSLFVYKFFSQTISKTLNPQWREQFDFHLYDEQGGFVDITVWDKDAGKKDDFMGRYNGIQADKRLCDVLL